MDSAAFHMAWEQLAYLLKRKGTFFFPLGGGNPLTIPESHDAIPGKYFNTVSNKL